MADPALVATLKDDWKKVATAIKSGNFIDKSPETKYYTYVETGNPAPNAATVTGGLANTLFESVVFSHASEADFYIYSKGVIGSIEVQI